MGGGNYFFWLGASADADPATRVSPRARKRSRPCGECPLREVGREILKAPLEEVTAQIDRAYDIIWEAIGDEA